MSFTNLGRKQVNYNIRRGYSFPEKTFTKRHGKNYDPPYELFENDGWQAQLEVECSKGGEPVFVANTEDVDSPLTIDPDEIVIGFVLTPEQTLVLDFQCCNYKIFIYKGDVDDPAEKLPIASGQLIVDSPPIEVVVP
jgi:hypothetical protein